MKSKSIPLNTERCRANRAALIGLVNAAQRLLRVSQRMLARAYVTDLRPADLTPLLRALPEREPQIRGPVQHARRKLPWQVTYYRAGTRRRHCFSSEAAAKAFKKQITAE